ncbi:MAG: hypothetical protein ACOZQL_05245 [Myxococcota bacterium]
MRHAVLLAFTSLLLVTSGCKTYCRQLSEKMCDCTNSTSEKTACLTTVSSKAGTYESNPTAESEARCEALLTECDCRLVDTPAGKEKCGFAEPSDGGL